MPESRVDFKERQLPACVFSRVDSVEEPMAFARHEWPREFLTLAIVAGLTGFWALVLLAAGTI